MEHDNLVQVYLLDNKHHSLPQYNILSVTFVTEKTFFKKEGKQLGQSKMCS